MKNIRFITSFCLILILFFLGLVFFESPKSIATFKRYSSPMYRLDKSLVKTLQNTNYSDDNSKKEIITTVLDILGYDKWKDYKEYIDIKIYSGNIFPNSQKQLILTLNLSKDLAVIVVFEEIGNSYVFHSKIENLSPVEKVEFIKHPVINKDFMLVYQILDESLGAFFYEHSVQIYNYNNLDFNLVWEKVIFHEEVYKENWINPNASGTKWAMIIEESQINFDHTDPLKINTTTSLKKYKTQSEVMPLKDKFSLVGETSHNKTYYWDDKYNAFVLGELTKEVFLSDVAIIDDMETKKEHLFGITNLYYKIHTVDGEIIYLPKSKFNTLFIDALYNENNKGPH